MTSLKPASQSFSVSSEHDESYNFHTIHAYLISFSFSLTICAHISDSSLLGSSIPSNMPPQEDDWSDSDQEELSDVETSVLLGVPDGPIDVETDLFDAAVSRIGGLPVRASSYV